MTFDQIDTIDAIDDRYNRLSIKIDTMEWCEKQKTIKINDFFPGKFLRKNRYAYQQTCGICFGIGARLIACNCSL